MLKNLERFDGKDRSKCLEWLSNVEIIAQHSKKSFRELVCQSMSPSLLHIFSSVSAFAFRPGHQRYIAGKLLRHTQHGGSSCETTEHADPTSEPLATFNTKYQQIHQVAYNISPDKQTDKTVIIDYVKKLPQYPRDKLLEEVSQKGLIHQDTTRRIPQCSRN